MKTSDNDSTTTPIIVQKFKKRPCFQTRFQTMKYFN